MEKEDQEQVNRKRQTIEQDRPRKMTKQAAHRTRQEQPPTTEQAPTITEEPTTTTMYQ